MGRTNGLYKEEYPVGTLVRVANEARLEEFAMDWRWHHPLEAHQLESAGREAEVAEVSFYHGGDELYILSGISGIWHEECLVRIETESERQGSK